MRLRSASGQAAVETVAMLPLIALVVAAVLTVFATGRAAESADAAAHAGAVALLQGADAAAAARAALDGWPKRAAHITVRGDRITVSVRPRVPIAPLSAALEARASVDASTSARPVPSATVVAGPERRGGDGRSGRR